jgi:hypothetical protein
MQAYEAGKPAYFATPPVNLIRAYHQSLLQITRDSSIPLEQRFQLHREAAIRVRTAAKDLGLKLVPTDAYFTANGMTAVGPSLISCTRVVTEYESRFTSPMVLVPLTSSHAWRRRASSLLVVSTRTTKVSGSALLSEPSDSPCATEKYFRIG